MTTPPDFDADLEAMQDELRANLHAVNDLHHPVYPSDPRRVAELERRIAELRQAVLARQHELRAVGPAQRASLDPKAEAQQTAAPAKVPQ